LKLRLAPALIRFIKEGTLDGETEVNCVFNLWGPGLHWRKISHWVRRTDPFTFETTYYRDYSFQVYGCGTGVACDEEPSKICDES